ncbi:glycoside hydrolase family 18 protein [Thiothrix lacustris]|uniref:glycoside hydrolase family 18 protein n=1 Tax=Thiothrix lacustris TaxID=525917 RepID=UPI00049085BC|nr:glycoside hydrolase family 18 protein [Thiothrix lacustris]
MMMNRMIKHFTVLLFSVVVLALPYSGIAGEKITKPWVTGYLPGYEQSTSGSFGFMDDDDWNMLTHAVHFASRVNADGSLDFSTESMGVAKRTAAISVAHQHNIPLLLSVLAWYDVYEPVIKNASTRATMINQLVATVKEGYDGVDLDLEPIRADQEGAAYETFVTELQVALKAVNKTNNPNMLLERPLLTVATGVENVADNNAGQLRTLLAKIQDKVDQINVMGYDLSSLSDEVVWHDGALSDGGQKYPTYSARSVVSVGRAIQQFIDGGVLPSKLGLGMSLEVRIWYGGKVKNSTDGATAPMQEWTVAPKNWNTGTPRASVAELMNPDYACMTTPEGAVAPYKCGYSPDKYRWDDKAKVPYLSINNPGSDYDAFISYTDERAVYEKVEFTKENKLGGLMIWHMRLDYMASKPAGKQRPIMKALRKALHTETGK